MRVAVKRGDPVENGGIDILEPRRKVATTRNFTKSESAMTTQNTPTNGKETSQNRSDASSSQAAQKSGRGFAGMDRERQREIASQGGRAAHASGNAHQFTSEEARLAGSKRHQNAAARTGSAHESRSDESAEA